MADERFNRWQRLGITQLSVAVSLVSALSIAGLGLGVALLKRDTPEPNALILVSMGLLFVAAFCSCGAVITRLLDFRLTARKVRKDSKPEYEKSLKIFGKDKDEYSRATWRLFWIGLSAFFVGAALIIVSFGNMYVARILWL